MVAQGCVKPEMVPCQASKYKKYGQYLLGAAVVCQGLEHANICMQHSYAIVIIAKFEGTSVHIYLCPAATQYHPHRAFACELKSEGHRVTDQTSMTETPSQTA